MIRIWFSSTLLLFLQFGIPALITLDPEYYTETLGIVSIFFAIILFIARNIKNTRIANEIKIAYWSTFASALACIGLLNVKRYLVSGNPIFISALTFGIIVMFSFLFLAIMFIRKNYSNVSRAEKIICSLCILPLGLGPILGGISIIIFKLKARSIQQ